MLLSEFLEFYDKSKKHLHSIILYLHLLPVKFAFILYRSSNILLKNYY